ncbi:MAG: hypothetical protein AB7O38_26010 [Pirellulaceae bacterium]
MPQHPPIPSPPLPRQRVTPVAGASPVAPPVRPSVTGEGASTDAGVATGIVSWLCGFRAETGRDATSFFVSLVVHALILIILALIVPAVRQGGATVALLLEPVGEADAGLELETAVEADLPALDASPLAPAISAPQAAVEVPTLRTPVAVPAVRLPLLRPGEEVSAIPFEDLLLRSNLPTGGGLEGRTASERARLAALRGGNAASENAVELALAWLAAHQHPDGSWSLRFADMPCRDQCGNPGTMETTTGATALALLPFLGAGYSHQSGPYKEIVHKGLYYLTSRMVETEHGGELHENITMYAHGIASLALCEAYGMTGDQNLQPYAQQAVDYIGYAQHPRGGWRYSAGQPGDTTVTGWQVMALKSARLAHLRVPTHVIDRVQRFLDSVQDSKGNGAFYGYQNPEKLPGPTAVGLLLRMYQGWPRDDERLSRGATYLAHLGPSPHDVYFNYYATQVLHHLENSFWSKWNQQLRDELIATQAATGHERGSWFFRDKHGSVGGRLYTTAMCAMILEVYYRYMPLYGDEAVTEAF